MTIAHGGVEGHAVAVTRTTRDYCELSYVAKYGIKNRCYSFNRSRYQARPVRELLNTRKVTR